MYELSFFRINITDIKTITSHYSHYEIKRNAKKKERTW